MEAPRRAKTAPAVGRGCGMCGRERLPLPGGDLPEGLDGADTYPALLAELMRRGWSDEMIAKLAGGNVLRVMEAAERVAASMANVPPATATVAMLDGK